LAVLCVDADCGTAWLVAARAEDETSAASALKAKVQASAAPTKDDCLFMLLPLFSSRPRGQKPAKTIYYRRFQQKKHYAMRHEPDAMQIFRGQGNRT
jgi:hypothetical protein